MQQAPYSRIAPTPSGFLHLGNLASFVLTKWWMHQCRGKLLLRIDDIDQDRTRIHFLQDIFDTLHFVDFNYDEGPKNVAAVAAQWSQRHRVLHYQHAIEKLIATGYVYACNCTRKTMPTSSKNGHCADKCIVKKLPLHAPNTALRLQVNEGAAISWTDAGLGPQLFTLPQSMGDFVIRGKNGRPAYQIVSLCDDVHFGITHIVRGIDLLPSTACQLYMAALLGFSCFQQIKFWHHPLLQDAAGNKLSKSSGSTSIKHWRENDGTSGQLLQQIAAIFWPQLKHRPVKSISDLLAIQQPIAQQWHV